MNYFDFQPEDLAKMPKSEKRAWRELVIFMKDVHKKVFTDPPVRRQLPREFLERYFRFRWQLRWNRQPQRSTIHKP